nr:DUF4192 domain-containing protein [Allonocardiopsis opalescens]
MQPRTRHPIKTCDSRHTSSGLDSRQRPVHADHSTPLSTQARSATPSNPNTVVARITANARCCPAGGVPFDADSSPVSAQAVVAGLAPWPSRDDLARSLEPVGGEAGAAMGAATDRAEQRLLRLDRGSAGPTALRRGIAAEGLPLVRSALDRHRRGGPPLNPDETAWLGVALCCLRVRDDAWVRTTPGTADADAVLWVHVLRHVTEPYRAAPAALLAFCAWQSGDTVLASVALERALSADPGYSMARLLMAVVMADMPPSGWPAISPADLARDYGESPPAS